ncbi:hypothetical protein BC830DRAFT_1115751 [Chytriomyces sp. MP71]|nr:hypothetical protein BC830DRAFT_1115751 [Chytriomyces sp. MP71]
MNSTLTPPANVSLADLMVSEQQMLSTTVFGLLCGGTLILLLGLLLFLKFAAPSSLAGYKTILLCILLILRASHYAAAAVDIIMGSVASKFARYLLLSATEGLYFRSINHPHLQGSLPRHHRPPRVQIRYPLRPHSARPYNPRQSHQRPGRVPPPLARCE